MSVQYVSGSAIDYIDTPAAPAAQDFWRTAPGNALPDGITDVQDDMGRNGRVSIAPNFGAGVPQTPVAALDIFGFAVRSGVDGRVANVTPLYVTGNLPATADITTPIATLVGGVEFRHSNQTQGIGFGYDVMYATGNAANQGLHFMNRGAGLFQFIHQTLNSGFNFFDYVSSAIAVNQGWQERYFAAGVQKMGMYHRQAATGVGGTSGMESFWQRTDAAGAFRNAMVLSPSVTNASTFSLTIDSDIINDAKLVLFGLNSTSFFGLGIKSSTFASFVGASGQFFRWYNGPSPGTLVMTLWAVNGGVLIIDPGTQSNGVGGGNAAIRFGLETSTEQIASNRLTAGRFLNDLEFGTAGVRRGAFLNNGRFYLSTVPVFVGDAAAGVGGLATGEVFQDALGVLHIKQ